MWTQNVAFRKKKSRILEAKSRIFKTNLEVYDADPSFPYLGPRPKDISFSFVLTVHDCLKKIFFLVETLQKTEDYARLLRKDI